MIFFNYTFTKGFKTCFNFKHWNSYWVSVFYEVKFIDPISGVYGWDGVKYCSRENTDALSFFSGKTKASDRSSSCP